MDRKASRRYYNKKKRVHFLCPFGHVIDLERHPFPGFVVMAPPLKDILPLFFAAVLIAAGPVFPARAAEPDDPVIRVELAGGVSSFSLAIDGFYSVEDKDAGSTVFTGKDLSTILTVRSGRMTAGGKEYRQKRIVFRPADADSLSVNGRKFHGFLEIVREGNSSRLINFVALEDYVKGIAVREISHYWPADALKAHAIVFRTYGLYAMSENKSKDRDVTSGVYSQVYGGSSAQRYRISEAVDETKGDVLVYKGKIFPAYFHSTCGGHTQDASALWNIDVLPLKGVDCFYCSKSPHYSWSAVIPGGAAVDKLRRAGLDIPGDFLSAFPGPRDGSGRLSEISFRMSKGAFGIKGKDFRNILGPDKVRSLDFEMKVSGGNIHLHGKGWGHGVGLCQWGAYFMSKSGHAFTDILSFYYPGSDIKNIKEISKL